MRRKSKHKIIMLFTAGFLIAGLTVLRGCKQYEEHPMNQSGTYMMSANPGDDIEQTLCPVSDKPINKQYYTEYKGKKVYFCCPACKPIFEKDPEKYIGKLPQFQEKK